MQLGKYTCRLLAVGAYGSLGQLSSAWGRVLRPYTSLAPPEVFKVVQVSLALTTPYFSTQRGLPARGASQEPGSGSTTVEASGPTASWGGQAMAIEAETDRQEEREGEKGRGLVGCDAHTQAGGQAKGTSSDPLSA